MRKDPLRHIYYKILSFLLYIKTKSRALIVRIPSKNIVKYKLT